MTAVDAELMDDDEVVSVPGANALMAINQSEINMQIATAKRYPRSIKEFKDRAEEVACLDAETAGTMFYTLKRKGQDGTKIIRGPSARLAEVAAMSYRNLRFGARVIEITDTQIVAQGFCMDLENNNGTQVEVRRRITDKNKRKFSEDMIVVTGNAACSIALRNAVFKIVPMALLKTVYEKAMQTSIGQVKSISETRQKLIDAFGKLGVAPSQIVEFCGRRGVEDITVEDIIDLRGLWTAIHDGDTSIEEAFSKDGGEAKGGIKGQSVKDALGPKEDAPGEKADKKPPAKKPEAKAAPAPAPAAKKAPPAKPAPVKQPEPEPEPEEAEEEVETDDAGEVIEPDEQTPEEETPADEDGADDAGEEEAAEGEAADDNTLDAGGTEASADQDAAEEEEFQLGDDAAPEVPAAAEPPRKGGGRGVSLKLAEVTEALHKARMRADVSEIMANLGDPSEWPAGEYKLAQDACEAKFDAIKRAAQAGPRPKR